MIEIKQDAMKRWNKIPSDIQKQLLSNVYCSNCKGMVTIVDFNMSLDRGDIILKGKCATCGGNVARLIESD